MSFDFDQVIERKGTNAKKWDYGKAFIGTDDVLPMWVADMDFAVPLAVKEAMVKRASHPIYGYSGASERFYVAMRNWMKRRYDVDVPIDWMVAIPGIVFGMYTIIEALTSIGDEIIIQPPVYPPFFQAVKNRGRQVIENPLIENDGYYTMDFDLLEKQITEKTKMILLCSPHNPVGRAWNKEELDRLTDICLRHGIYIVSDEIHADVVYEKKHIPTFTISEKVSQQTITFLSGSKTFNLGGLYTSIAFSENKNLMLKFKNAVARSGTGSVNLFGIEATIAAYEEGEAWLDALLPYLQENARFAQTYIAHNIPTLQMHVPEATFLGWADFRQLGLTNEELSRFLIEKAKLWLNDGHAFGTSGSGFARLNFGCPRITLLEGLQRLEKAVNKHGLTI